MWSRPPTRPEVCGGCRPSDHRPFMALDLQSELSGPIEQERALLFRRLALARRLLFLEALLDGSNRGSELTRGQPRELRGERGSDHHDARSLFLLPLSTANAH